MIDTSEDIGESGEIGKRQCVLPNCSRSGPLTVFKICGILKLIACAIELHDDETRQSMQSILDSEEDNASVELHKGCYCSFTSKNHVENLRRKKKLQGSEESDDTPASRTRRSQVSQFDFKKHCLFCAQICNPLDPKHPDRWDRVLQCERKGAALAAPFKDTVLKLCDRRHDQWSNEVETAMSWGA